MWREEQKAPRQEDKVKRRKAEDSDNTKGGRGTEGWKDSQTDRYTVRQTDKQSDVGGLGGGERCKITETERVRLSTGLMDVTDALMKRSHNLLGCGSVLMDGCC